MNALKVSTFGEALFRMNPPRGIRWEQASTLELYLGGTELNIAANLVSLGTQAAWISVLPEGEVGEMMQARLRESGVDINVPFKAQGSAGWYMLEEATRPRSDKVLSRHKSVLGYLDSLELNWSELFKGSSWFHTSGVSAGLSLECTKACLKGLQAAKSLGLTTSYDLNFRKNLWDFSEAKKRQAPLLEWVDVLVCSPQEYEDYFANEAHGKTFIFPHRDEDESLYWIEVLKESKTYCSKKISITLTDRIGVGDSMMAGWIHATLQGMSLEQSVEFAAACGAMKYSVKGDWARLKQSEVKDLMEHGFKVIKR